MFWYIGVISKLEKETQLLISDVFLSPSLQSRWFSEAKKARGKKMFCFLEGGVSYIRVSYQSSLLYLCAADNYRKTATDIKKRKEKAERKNIMPRDIHE